MHGKEKKKVVSFLSRLNFGGMKNKNEANSDEESDSEPDNDRTEGMNAQVFSRSKDASGFIPVHKDPPRYIKVRAKGKKDREFGRVFLAQELRGTTKEGAPSSRPASIVGSAMEEGKRPSSSSARSGTGPGGAIWTTEFSIDGKYLAAAGQDQIVRVWSVISTPTERAEQERDEDLGGVGSERLSTPVFKSKPLREFTGHTSTVLDLSWSKNNFLLSSSIDKTVRLWHVSREECLCTFKHKDFVTSIAFHPRDDRFFLAGSLDGVLRLWSIPDKNVAFWAKAPEMITSVGFVPDGRTAIAGGNGGLLGFYDTEGLSFVTQVHVRSSRGKNAKGSKITGIRTMCFPPNNPNGEVKVLVSSNDSRIRLYNLRDKSLEMKFKGHENVHSQIRASFSEDGRYVICGSEDRRTYIWSLFSNDGDSMASGKDKHPVESFASHGDVVTTSIIAPAKTRQLLGASGDPIYDLCNPPPVTLLSRAETRGTTTTDIPAGDKRLSDTPSNLEPTPTNAYLARARHEYGNTIITASHGGSIKVFRQDCAANKRRNDSWENSSIFKQKLGRQASMMSRKSGSTGRQSRRSSITMSTMGGIGGILGSRGSNPNLKGEEGNHHHILNWAHGIHSNHSSDAVGNGHLNRQLDTSTGISAAPSTAVSETPLVSRDRSQSPPSTSRWGAGRKSVSSLNPPSTILLNRGNGPASEARQAPYKGAISANSTPAPMSPASIGPTSMAPMTPPQPGFVNNVRTGSAGGLSTTSSMSTMSQDAPATSRSLEMQGRERPKSMLPPFTASTTNSQEQQLKPGQKEPAPGGLLPTPSFSLKTEDNGGRFWGLGKKDKDSKRRNSILN